MRIALLASTVAIVVFPAATASAQWTGGPILISGMDPDYHNTDLLPGSFDATYRDNWTGALFIQQGFDYIRRHLDFESLSGRGF